MWRISYECTVGMKICLCFHPSENLSSPLSTIIHPSIHPSVRLYALRVDRETHFILLSSELDFEPTLDNDSRWEGWWASFLKRGYPASREIKQCQSTSRKCCFAWKFWWGKIAVDRYQSKWVIFFKYWPCNYIQFVTKFGNGHIHRYCRDLNLPLQKVSIELLSSSPKSRRWSRD